MIKKNGSGDYEVGYGKPPKDTRFKPGVSGNPKGAPKKEQQQTIDVAKILDEPVLVTKGKKIQKMTGFEVAVRKLVSRALKDGNLDAAIQFIRICIDCDILGRPPTPQSGGGVLHVPRGWEVNEWLEAAEKRGLLNWPNNPHRLGKDKREDDEGGKNDAPPQMTEIKMNRSPTSDMANRQESSNLGPCREIQEVAHPARKTEKRLSKKSHLKNTALGAGKRRHDERLSI